MFYIRFRIYFLYNRILICVILKITNSNSQINFIDLPSDDPKQRKPDIQKVKKTLNWEPEPSLEDGLVKTINYFKKII